MKLLSSIMFGMVLLLGTALAAQALSPVALQITSISPARGPVGTTVAISGFGFSPKNNALNFAGARSALVHIESEDNGTRISLSLPATPCENGMACDQVILRPGTYPLSITNEAGGTSNTVYFTVTAPSPPPTDPPYQKPPESKQFSVLVRSAHTNAPIENARVSFVNDRGVAIATRTTNPGGVVKFEETDMKVALIVIEADTYIPARLSGSEITREGGISAKLSLVNPPPPPVIDPLHPPEGGTLENQPTDSLPQRSGFWWKFRVLLYRLGLLGIPK